jgi:hypothetical protein
MANLDLPSEQELINMAEKNVNRHLYPREIDRLKKMKEKMEKISGVGSYN